MKYREKWRLIEDTQRWILPMLRVTWFLKAFLFIVMPHFSCSIAIGSKEVREDPYDRIKYLDHLSSVTVIFPYGIDSVFLDISMHCIEIIESKTKYQYIESTKDCKQRNPQ